MITPRTKAAIAVLRDIYTGESTVHTDEFELSEQDSYGLLSQFTTAGLIILRDKENPIRIESYSPAKDITDVSLLDILEATDEHLNCNHSTTENFYIRYGMVAHKLGVVNQLTRTYLKDIKLFDL